MAGAKEILPVVFERIEDEQGTVCGVSGGEVGDVSMEVSTNRLLMV